MSAILKISDLSLYCKQIFTNIFTLTGIYALNLGFWVLFVMLFCRQFCKPKVRRRGLCVYS